MAQGAALVAALALAACSSESGTSPEDGTNPPPTNTLPPGITISGNVVTVNLAVSNDLTEFPGLVMILGRTTRPVLLVRSGTTAAPVYRAYNAACPHQGTQNAWQDAGDDIRCERHGSQFARSNGAATAGVASRGLTTLPTTRAGNVLTVNAA